MTLNLKFVLFILCFLLSLGGIAQQAEKKESPTGKTKKNSYLLSAKVIDGDTIPVVYLHTIVVAEQWSARKRRKYSRRYQKLIRDVKKAYPYAKLAGKKLKLYEKDLEALPNDRSRRKFMKNVETELRDEFEGDLRNLTVKQGVILIKLVDRETGDTSYELVKQFRGSFSAFFWQSVARLFGHNLKLDYDPFGEDYLIEEVIQLIETGKV